MNKSKNLLGLYIHWPYCESKCPYCDFNSHVNESIDIDSWIKSYTNQIYQMKEDIIEYNLNYDGLSSIFFGGGTPSLMPLEIIESILNISYKLFNLNRDIEISLEANPSSYEIEKFVDLKKLGINRLSVGVQSLNSKNLHFLGRLHNVNDVYNALDHATKTFDNVSIDLMYAFYGQDLNLWIDELENFLQRYDLTHISLYQLTIEKGTKFFTDYKKGLIQLIDNDLAADFYNKTNMILSKYLFNRYEISNYSKLNFECKHNLNYWNSDSWIGIGPGAYGRLWSLNPKLQRIEYQNYKNPKSWVNQNVNYCNFEKIKLLNTNDTDIDTLSMGLRLEKGFRVSKLIDKKLIKSEQFKTLQDKKIIFEKDGFIVLSENYLIKLNSIINFLMNN
jgi:putative oxygen-independent coproporphyrinogen III oxidase